jgi:hypothetical protein
MRSRFGSHRKKWRLVATVTLTTEPIPAHQPLGSSARYEAMLWRQYSLAGMLPMHYAQCTDDRDISATLRHVARTEKLPWEFTDHEWNTICKPIP